MYAGEESDKGRRKAFISSTEERTRIRKDE